MSGVDVTICAGTDRIMGSGCDWRDGVLTCLGCLGGTGRGILECACGSERLSLVVCSSDEVRCQAEILQCRSAAAATE